MGQRRLMWTEFIGFLWTAAAGVLLHFLWDWTGKNRIVAAFSPVNESVWEHMKLLFFPLLVLTMVQVWFRDERNFLASRGLSAFLGTVLIPVLYYTYTGVVGQHFLWADIAVFLVSAAAAFLLDGHLLSVGRYTSGWQQVAGLTALWLLAFLFVLWTYRPPALELFRDSSTGLIGLPGA